MGWAARVRGKVDFFQYVSALQHHFLYNSDGDVANIFTENML